MLEFEKKIMLTEQEYRSISMVMCKFDLRETQINYYFDDSEFSMDKKGITCRIREKDGIYKATVKKHDFKFPECSMEVDFSENTEFEPLIFNVLGLQYKGKLATERIIMYDDTECKMVLDKNEYLGTVDFELEVEYKKEYQRRAQVLIENIAECLASLGHSINANEFLSRAERSKSKSQRFIKRLVSCK